jgi:hypothetical protein
MTNSRIHGKYLFRLALAFVSVATCNVLSAQCPASFTAAPGSPIPVGVNPANPGVGDFNGDGKLDLAVPNNGSFTVSILLGNGNGTFTEAIGSPFAVGVNPSHAAVGDFNGDGKLDLAVTNNFDRNIWILLGNGAGQFTLAGSPIPTRDSRTLGVADFNRDGKLDIAAENYATNDVSILLGNGNGTFTEALGSPIPVGTTPTSVAMGDFNGDGKLDLAVGNALSDNISILLGDGAGGFGAAPGSPIPVGVEPLGSVGVADFNGDHKLDFAVANFGSNNVSIMLGDGTGGFASALGSPIGLGSQAVWVGVADFNGDNKLDLAVSNYNSNTVSILLGDGTGSFTFSGALPTAGSGAGYLEIGDFNGDNKPDLAVSNVFSNDVTILLNTSPCLRTPQQATRSLIDSINTLINQGVLNRGRGNSLVQKLEAALQQMNRGNSNPAQNQLGAFINEVNALMKSKALSASQGQSLIDAAGAIINQLTG